MSKCRQMLFGCMLGFCMVLATGCQSTVSEKPIINTTQILTEKSVETIANIIDVSAGGVFTITENGTYEIKGKSDNAAILVNGDKIKVNLVLSGVEMKNPTGPCIFGNKSKSITINLATGTTNVLSDGSSYEKSSDGAELGKGVIFSNDDIIITGEGKLELEANYKHGICSDDSLTVSGGNIIITKAASDGLHCNDILTVDGGVLEINASSDVMQSETDVILNGGVINGKSNDEGIEGKNAVYINGGDIIVEVSDDGINAGSYIEINAGTLSVTASKGDAIDSNGTIVINGGDIYAAGGMAPEGALDCDNDSVYINGGHISAIGSVNSPISSDSKQVSVVYGSTAKDDVVKILDSNKNEIYSYTAKLSGTTLIISVPELEIGKVYTITKNGTEDMSFTVESAVVQAGGSAEGMKGMGGMGGFRVNKGDFKGEMPEGFEGFQNGERPDGFEGFQRGERPEGFENFQRGERPEMPNDRPENTL